jgi:hypothetical protein
MARRKYSGEQEIRDKIETLFSYRKLSDLLLKCNETRDGEFYSHLTDIQYQIYLLDAYLEGNWNLEKSSLNAFWDSIYASLAKLNYSPGETDKMVSEIREYERIEKNCRKGKWPTKVSFKSFYTTKSCDVRLVRHLIYDAHPELNKIWKEKSWANYDLITEINDDIGDVIEDLHTYNGNRFLISVLRKGIRKTEMQYKAYLGKVTAKAKAYFKDHREYGENGQLSAWTTARSKETLDLLDKIFVTNDPAIYRTSLLLEKMK